MAAAVGHPGSTDAALVFSFLFFPLRRPMAPGMPGHLSLIIAIRACDEPRALPTLLFRYSVDVRRGGGDLLTENF